MTARHLLVATLAIFVWVNQSPAPIQEEPTPTPAPEKSIKAKSKRAVESKTERARSPSPTPATSKKFAGKWSGIMPEVPWGNVQTELIVDPTEATMEWQES